MSYIDIHTHQNQTLETTIAVVNRDQTQWQQVAETPLFSLGLHPWHTTATNWEADFETVKRLSAPAVAIGECGLDRLRGPELPLQIAIFEAHIRWAETLNKPVIIHCVKAFDHLLALKKRMNIHVPLIIHGFNQNPHILHQLLAQNYYISIGAALFKAKNAVFALKTIPLHKLFLETDAQNIYDIKAIYTLAATHLNMPIEDLKAQIMHNWQDIKKAAL